MSDLGLKISSLMQQYAGREFKVGQASGISGSGYVSVGGQRCRPIGNWTSGPAIAIRTDTGEWLAFMQNPQGVIANEIQVRMRRVYPETQTGGFWFLYAIYFRDADGFLVKTELWLGGDSNLKIATYVEEDQPFRELSILAQNDPYYVAVGRQKPPFTESGVSISGWTNGSATLSTSPIAEFPIPSISTFQAAEIDFETGAMPPSYFDISINTSGDVWSGYMYVVGDAIFSTDITTNPTALGDVTSYANAGFSTYWSTGWVASADEATGLETTLTTNFSGHIRYKPTRLPQPIYMSRDGNNAWVAVLTFNNVGDASIDYFVVTNNRSTKTVFPQEASIIGNPRDWRQALLNLERLVKDGDLLASENDAENYCINKFRRNRCVNVVNGQLRVLQLDGWEPLDYDPYSNPFFDPSEFYPLYAVDPSGKEALGGGTFDGFAGTNLRSETPVGLAVLENGSAQFPVKVYSLAPSGGECSTAFIREEQISAVAIQQPIVPAGQTAEIMYWWAAP